ncbi:MAG: hypothetical protein LBG80_17320 [Bacteroidales bacterium]|jgi:hypothetical protein|nr:hypothetical protein [Bacteroidales bacterium]
MDKKKRNNLILIIISLSILTIAFILIISRRSGTLDASEKNFAVKDTSAITKIFLANSYEEQTLLERKNGQWIVNGKHDIVQDNIDDLLNCIYNIVVKDIVAKSSRSTINKRMSSGSTKVEIYYDDYRISLGKLKLFKYTHKKTYYIGQPTMDNLGNYAIMEGSSIPCVVYLPGFRGFISPKYNPSEDAWKSHHIVRLRMSKIKEINSVDYTNPANSFHITRGESRHFNIIQTSSNQRLAQYDTLRLLDFLSDFRNLNYESMATGFTQGKKDSIFSRKFKEVRIEDTDGNITSITMFYLEDEYASENEYSHDIDFMETYNRDRFYAIINGDKNEIVRCQYFVFDRIVQPIEFFFTDSKIVPVPKVQELNPDNDTYK